MRDNVLHIFIVVKVAACGVHLVRRAGNVGRLWRDIVKGACVGMELADIIPQRVVRVT